LESTPQEVQDQGRLPAAGMTHRQCHLSVSASRSAESLPQVSQLFVASDALVAYAPIVQRVEQPNPFGLLL
jgi:hypothetical protein